jgi:hypothetical protein
MAELEARDDTGPSRVIRVGVAAVLVLLLVPGLIGFDAWPLTAWRLFSLARGNQQTHWVLDAVDGDGAERPVDLEELPLPYRTAEWPLAALPSASEGRRDAVCVALLDAVVERHPATVALQIVRDRQAQVERDGAWVVDHHREPFHRCTVEPAP